MGIPGFSTFVGRNSDLTQPHRLHDTKVVIDGTNLLYYVYELSSKEMDNHKFGGDYITYQATIRKFFKALQRCKVEPIIVFDGGMDRSQQKMKTIMKRIQSRLDNCKEATKVGSHIGLILPILSQSVLKETLREMGVKFVQCLAEADMHVASLANHYRVPVVSNDSDFFIYDLNSGFIKLESIDYKNVRQFTDENGAKKYLDSYYYEVQHLLDFFPGLDRKMLPLFSTLMGNDYVNIKCFEKVINSLPYVKSKRSLKANQRQMNMIRLLDWMQNKTLKESTDFLINCLKVEDRQAALNIIQFNKNTFQDQTDISAMLQILNGDDEVTGNFGDPFISKRVPHWFLRKYLHGDLDPFLIDIYFVRKVFLMPQIDDLQLPSSYIPSYTIQNFLFSLLMFDSPSLKIELYDRKGSDYKKKIMKLDANSQQISLGSYVAMTPLEKHKILLKLIWSSCYELKQLNSKLAMFNLEFDQQLSTLILLVKHWIKRVRSTFRECLMAILSTVLFYYFVNDSDRLPSLSQKEKCIIKTNFSKFEHQPYINHAHTFKVRVTHSFNELQAIILFFNRIQCIADCGFPPISPSLFFQGTTIYNLCVNLYRRVEPQLYVNLQFGQQSSLTSLFNVLMSFIEGTNPLKRGGKVAKESEKVVDDIF